MTIPVDTGMTSRLVVMMTSADKRAVEDRARAVGLTPSEFVRRAAREHVPVDPAEARALERVAVEVESTVAAMRADLARLDADLAAHRAEMNRLKAPVAG